VSEVKIETCEQALSAWMSMLCQFQVFSWSVTDLEDSSQLPKMEGNNSTHIGQSEPILVEAAPNSHNKHVEESDFSFLLIFFYTHFSLEDKRI
jgi:hypothetical protein